MSNQQEQEYNLWTKQKANKYDNSLKDIWNNKELRLEKLKAGDIYKEGEDYYICRTDCSYYFPPRSDNIDTVANDSGNWIKINLNGSTNYN